MLRVWPPTLKACGLAGLGQADAKAGPLAPSTNVEPSQQVDLGFFSPELMVTVPAADVVG